MTVAVKESCCSERLVQARFRHGRGGCGLCAAPAQTLFLEVEDLVADVARVGDHDGV